MKIVIEYTNFANIFSYNLKLKLLKNTSINIYTIKLVKDKPLFYRPIYILNIVKLETVKANIQTHIRMSFIQYSKSLASALILSYIKKFDNNS